MHLIRQLPGLVVANGVGAAIALLVTVEHVPWPIALAWAWIPLLTVPMAIVWLKRRHAPRPAHVPGHLIRVAGWYALLLGLSWVAITVVNLPRLPQTNQALLLMGHIVLCAVTVASISALPWAALGYFVPMMIMVCRVTTAHGTLAYKPVAVLGVLTFVALFGWLRQNWRSFRRNVAVSVERRRLAERGRRETARRAEAEQALRAVEDAALASAEEVKAAQRRLQSIVETLPLPVAIFRRADARAVYANQGAADLARLSIPEMLARTSDDFFREPGEGGKLLDQARDGAPVVDRETVLTRGDGTGVPVRLTAIPIVHDGAEALLASIEDISLRKQHEAELARARQAAEDLGHAKSLFLANVSRELRAPLDTIIGDTARLQDSAYGDVPTQVAEALARVEASGRQLLGFIDDVLDLSKIESGQLTLSLADYSMAEVVEGVLRDVEGLAADKRLALRADVPPALPPGFGDDRRLTQALLILVGNAIKFTDAGRVAVKVTLADGAFTVSVGDTGPGIAAHDQRRIFEEFEQVAGPDARTRGGAGLGLAIARHIVEMHGGRVWVASVPGHGATFRFRIPIRVDAGRGSSIDWGARGAPPKPPGWLGGASGNPGRPSIS